MSGPEPGAARALSRTFGRDRVDPGERERRVRDLFGRIAGRYDLMNDLMSLGVHRLWKRTLAWAVDARAGERILDVAGGTGDVAFLVGGADREAIVCDPSRAMMRAGRARAGGGGVGWIAGTAEALPIADASVDAVTISFGLRNVTDVHAALVEMRRVLVPGGRLFCLEFSRPWVPVRPFYDAFSRFVIPRLGAWVARDPGAYRYLVESIREFPDQAALVRIFEHAGFVDVHYRDFGCGIAAVHVGANPA